MSIAWETGTVVAGRFRLEARIGHGAIGTVWRCRDVGEEPISPSPLALKLVVFTEGRPRERRFLREAKATMRLTSPHVVRLEDAGVFGWAGSRVGYLAMELLEGETLETRLERCGRLGAEETLGIFEQVGRAVSLAHRLGLIHRDLKPANVFLCDDGIAKLLDLGLTKSFAAPLVPEASSLTRIGDMLGTPLYMSPEQAAGSEAVDHRADLWSLGVMVFECLTGRRLFEVSTLPELLEALREGALPVPSRLADVPPGFDAWFNRAVARDVQARFQSASMLVEELAQALAPDRTRRAPLALESDPHTALHVESGEQRTVRRMPERGPVLFGRGRALLAIEDAFAAHARVVTLCGARGTGRRALARAHAAALSEVYTGGVWPCPLGGCADAEAMWRRFAAAVGTVVDEEAPVAGIARAAAALGRALVIFERVERIREHLAPVVRELLRGAPQLRIVVTGDVPLSVASERVIELGGLSVPPIEERGPEAARSSAAMRMLGASMRAALAEQPPEVIAACASVVRRLNGHPLAIRLLGTTAIPLADVAPRLTAQALSEEAGPDRAVREAAAVVFAALPGGVRRGLIELSCFRGPFTVEAAEQVVSEEGAAVVAMLPRLARCGWLESDGRLSMPPMIRKVCGGRLRSTPQEALELFERHGLLFARSGEEEGVGALLRRGGLGLWTRALDDAEDVAAALERAKKRSSHDLVLRCARALGVVELGLGRHHAAARLLLVAMSSAAPADPLFSSTVGLRVRALIAAGRCDSARELATRTAVHAPPPPGRALAQALLAYARAELASGEAARAVDASLRARDACPDLDVVADADVLRARAGDARRRELLESAVATYRTLGESLCEAEALELLGRLDGALAIYRRLGARMRVANVLLRRAAEGPAGDASVERDRQEAAAMLAELGKLSQLVPVASAGP